jgi:hypothetical protein
VNGHPTSLVVTHLMHGIPDPQSDAPRVHELLNRELAGLDLYNVLVGLAKGEEKPAALSLEARRVALYRLTESHTLSRELLHLEGAVVRSDVHVGEGRRGTSPSRSQTSAL